MRGFFINVHWDGWVEADPVIVCRSVPLFHIQLVFKVFQCQVGSSWVKIKGKKYFSETCAGAYLGLIWQFGCFHVGYIFFYALEKGEEVLSPWTCLVPAFFAAVLQFSSMSTLLCPLLWKNNVLQSVQSSHWTFFSMLRWQCFWCPKTTARDLILCQYL